MESDVQYQNDAQFYVRLWRNQYSRVSLPSELFVSRTESVGSGFVIGEREDTPLRYKVNYFLFKKYSCGITKIFLKYEACSVSNVP
jgi:hypothetical protein